MDPVVTVDTGSVAVEPGGQASVTVRVRNLSSIVEGFRLDVLGEAAGWARVLPDHLEVLPQGEAMATVLFTPPAGIATRAGDVPFGIRALSQVDGTSSGVAEGDLQVSGVSQSQARITPVTSKGRFSGKHRVEFSNWGNTPVRLRLEASDPDDALGFLVTPEILDLPLGSSGAARVKVRARQPSFLGAPQRRPFRVVGRPVGSDGRTPAPGPPPQAYGYDPTQPAVDGAFEQKAMVRRGIVPLLVMGALAAGTIGFLMSRKSDDPAAETGTPPVPVGFAATALTSDTARVNWTPGDGIDFYTVYTIEGVNKDIPVPPAAIVSPPIDGDQGQFDVTGLAAGTEYCFQLAATRGEAQGGRTAPQCLTTPQVNAPGAPTAPENVRVSSTEDGFVVEWDDTTDGAATHVVRRGDTVVASVEPPLGQADVEVTEDERCFTVQAKVGDLVSEISPQACAESEEGDGGAGGAGGAGGGAPGNLGVIVLPTGKLPQVEDPNGREVAEQEKNALIAAGLENVNILLSTDYPDLNPPLARASYLVYVGGFPNETVARDFCTGRQITPCDLYTPGEPKSGATGPGPVTSSGTPTTVAPPAPGG
ncbi:MAG TPA: fibronectin type III domain-containing protein [Acidimicrobiales bacterium]|nr:fibronectin type III domain-containing protein [Acidimicrobiales bacterium]